MDPRLGKAALGRGQTDRTSKPANVEAIPDWSVSGVSRFHIERALPLGWFWPIFSTLGFGIGG